jgi:hypothetical protein
MARTPPIRTTLSTALHRRDACARANAHI